MVTTDPQRVARVLGLTGPIACGKTTVGDFLLELGARDRIDADRVVHDLFHPGTAMSIRVLERFGPTVRGCDGGVDRAALGRIVFTDVQALRDLEAIVHPTVREAIRERIARQRHLGGVLVVDAVKLLQSDLLALCDAVWIVTCPMVEQQRRLTVDRGMDEIAAQARLRAQPDFSHFGADERIDNASSLNALRERVTVAWNTFLANS